MTSIPDILSILLNRRLPPLIPEKLFDDKLKVSINSIPIPGSQKALLHLLNDDIESAHNLAQENEGDDIADFVHAILHRREGDYWNSKWWIRRLSGEHFKKVWDGDAEKAQAFVDDCELCKRNEDSMKLQEIQWEELKNLAKIAFE